MITIKKEFPFAGSYPLSRLGKPEELLFFDIETTGFSGDYAALYLIGCVYFEDGRWKLIQWFADDRACEAKLLTEFFSFMKGFRFLVHFNGDKFDIPFLLKRCSHLGLPYGFSGMESIDIYKKIKPYKRLLQLENLKQKTIEAFLGVDREDAYNGGQLIAVYEEYLSTKKEFLLNLLLLHNEDDLKGMPQVLPILFYPDFFSQIFRLRQWRETEDGARLRLLFAGDPATCLPVPLSASSPSYSYLAGGNELALSVRLYEGTLKYFYPNYRDYYYLIYEDAAIHKSVGEYVDKEARVKATKDTCYTKKCGRFLPQPTPLWTPEFRNSCRDKSCFFEFTPECFEDGERINEYLRQVIKEVLS